MKKLARLRNHAVLLVTAALITAGAHLGLSTRYADERNKLAQKAAGVRSREVEAAWKTLPYTNATQAGVRDAFLSKIDMSTLNLSDLQKSKLQSRLKQVLRYLAAPTFEQYCELKTEGLQYRFKPSPAAHRIMTGRASKGYEPVFNQTASDIESFGPASPPLLSTASAVLERTFESDGGGLVTTRGVWAKLYGSGDRLSLSRLTGICLEHVAVATSSTNSPTALLKGNVRKGWTTATEALNPGFEYPALPDRPTASGNRSLFFQLSFFAQTNDGDKAGPVYLCLGWLPEDQKWALCRMLSDSMLGIHILFQKGPLCCEFLENGHRHWLACCSFIPASTSCCIRVRPRWRWCPWTLGFVWPSSRLPR